MCNRFHLKYQRGPAYRWFVVALFSIIICGCVGIPDNATAVRNFNLERYLGTWYEIARLDHRFERGPSQVHAEYTMRDDGGVSVMNSGYSQEDGQWKRAKGRAYLVDKPDIGRLKVAFFGPLYGAYNIVALDNEHYTYSMVISSNTSYLWILARQPTLDSGILDQLVTKAGELGFDTGALIYPEHSVQTN